MLDIDNIFFSYGSHELLTGVDLSLAPGEIGTLLGASGAGKTTLFKLITGLIPPQTGQIRVNGRCPPGSASQVAYMMQEDLLLPWRRALGNILLGKELGHRPRNRQEDYTAALTLLNEVGLSGREDFYPHQLSGGMRQRVALARVLIQDRPLLLLDEPFGALDVNLREQLYELLISIRDRHGMTILLITHDFRDALMLSDRIFLMAQGRVQHQWSVSPETRSNPRVMGETQEELRQALSHQY